LVRTLGPGEGGDESGEEKPDARPKR